jgi:predicted NBD/HSP70 family sugar kinase
MSKAEPLSLGPEKVAHRSDFKPPASKVEGTSLGLALAIDVGGTAIKAGLVDGAGDIRHIVRASTPSGENVKAADVLSRIVEAARDVCSSLPDDSKPVGTAI